MITVENDYESVTYEEAFSSHLYENQLELLNNYYLGPNNNIIQTTQEVHKINTENSFEKNEIKNLTTNHIYQNVQKKPPREKNLDNSISLRKSKKQRISTTRS